MDDFFLFEKIDKKVKPMSAELKKYGISLTDIEAEVLDALRLSKPDEGKQFRRFTERLLVEACGRDFESSEDCKKVMDTITSLGVQPRKICYEGPDDMPSCVLLLATILALKTISTPLNKKVVEYEVHFSFEVRCMLHQPPLAGDPNKIEELWKVIPHEEDDGENVTYTIG